MLLSRRTILVRPVGISIAKLARARTLQLPVKCTLVMSVATLPPSESLFALLGAPRGYFMESLGQQRYATAAKAAARPAPDRYCTVSTMSPHRHVDGFPGDAAGRRAPYTHR